jgi:hypothetical protein
MNCITLVLIQSWYYSNITLRFTLQFKHVLADSLSNSFLGLRLVLFCSIISYVFSFFSILYFIASCKNVPSTLPIPINAISSQSPNVSQTCLFPHNEDGNTKSPKLWTLTPSSTTLRSTELRLRYFFVEPVILCRLPLPYVVFSA